MNLQQATLEDYASILAFYDDVIDRTPEIGHHAWWQKGKHPTAEDILAYLEEGSMYLCREDGAIVAVMALTPYQGEDYHPVAWPRDLPDDEVAVVHILAVSPDRQGEGIGEQMVRGAVRISKELGKKALRLDTLLSNTPAQRLYERLGFVRRGQQRLYAENTGWTEFLFYEYAGDGAENSCFLETPRLRFRPWRDSDADVLFKYASDPEVGPRAGWPPHGSVEESLTVIRDIFSNGHTWALELKENSEPVGCMCYYPFGESNIDIGEDDAELGYWIARPYWNRGLCTEALRAMVSWCFNVKGFHVLWSDFFVDNPASGRVMEKCGFRDTGEVNWYSHLYRGGERPVKVMRLDYALSPSTSRPHCAGE